MISLHCLPLALAYQFERHLRQLIPSLQLQHWQRRRQHADQLRSILAHAATRLLLADKLSCPANTIRFSLQSQGKPVLAAPSKGWHFNISHSGQWVVIALARYPVGVDIEYHADSPEAGLLEHCFTAQEQMRIHSRSDFYHAWCSKEAALKAAGTGFQIAPLALELIPKDSNTATVRSEHSVLNGLHVARSLWQDSYSLAWSCAHPPHAVDLHELSAATLQKHINRHDNTDNSPNLCNSSHYHEQYD